VFFLVPIHANRQRDRQRKHEFGTIICHSMIVLSIMGAPRQLSNFHDATIRCRGAHQLMQLSPNGPKPCNTHKLAKIRKVVNIWQRYISLAYIIPHISMSISLQNLLAFTLSQRNKKSIQFWMRKICLSDSHICLEQQRDTVYFKNR
jgi:hypothetical protein